MSRLTRGEKIFSVFNYIILSLLIIATIYPFYFVLIASVSSSLAVKMSGGMMLLPDKVSFHVYRLVLGNKNILIGYGNTLFYVLIGTFINVFLTIFGGYALSRKWLMGRNVFMFLITFTMFFSGGLIPSYLLISNLGMINSRWVLIIPNAIAVWNIIITRTFLSSIPESLEESAKMDGANDYTVMFRIMMPLSMPIISVNTLFYAVGHWNSWFGALIYLKDRNLYPLQLFLREILFQAQVQEMSDFVQDPLAENIKYATIIVSTLPILCVYPFLQKYFAKGVMVGAIKG